MSGKRKHLRVRQVARSRGKGKRSEENWSDLKQVAARNNGTSERKREWMCVCVLFTFSIDAETDDT